MSKPLKVSKRLIYLNGLLLIKGRDYTENKDGTVTLEHPYRSGDVVGAAPAVDHVQEISADKIKVKCPKGHVRPASHRLCVQCEVEKYEEEVKRWAAEVDKRIIELLYMDSVAKSKSYNTIKSDTNLQKFIYSLLLRCAREDENYDLDCAMRAVYAEQAQSKIEASKLQEKAECTLARLKQHLTDGTCPKDIYG